MKISFSGVAAILTAIATVITALTEFYKEYSKGQAQGILPSPVEGEITVIDNKK